LNFQGGSRRLRWADRDSDAALETAEIWLWLPKKTNHLPTHFCASK